MCVRSYGYGGKLKATNVCIRMHHIIVLTLISFVPAEMTIWYVGTSLMPVNSTDPAFVLIAYNVIWNA